MGRAERMLVTAAGPDHNRSWRTIMAEAHPIPTHPRFQNLIGRVFGRLTVLAYAGRLGKNAVSYWLCRCTCGTEKVVNGGSLTIGETQSCGCLRREMLGDRVRTHGMTNSSEFSSWRSMLSRCYEPRNASYPRYGARGVTVCQRWRDSFEAFLADMGPKPTPRHSIERQNSTVGYQPGNCVWATRKQQQRHLCSNRHITHDGQTRLLVEWAEITGLGRVTITRRLAAGWTVHDALTRPIDTRRLRKTHQ
jgi:hypothetical protein